jgi:hypothetical protein
VPFGFGLQSTHAAPVSPQAVFVVPPVQDPPLQQPPLQACDAEHALVHLCVDASHAR